MSNNHVVLSGISAAVFSAGLLLGIYSAYAGSPKEIQEQAKAMVRDAEEMVMHGNMGDGKAIVHHCADLSKQAQAILKSLPSTNEHAKEAVPHLQDVINYCKRVAEMGDKVDPGASLNPATKARAAAREIMKHLAAMKDEGA